VPELPEVETIKNELLPHVIGRKIEGVDIFWDKMVRKPSFPEFRAQVIGRQITGITRRGKYLFFHLGNSDVLVMHMKMTGSLLVNPSDRKFTRVILHLDKGIDLHFWDPRKFGRIWLDKDEKNVLKKLGPEPLDDNFTADTLAGLLHNRKAPIKPIILDQSIIAGIGNMYADEALFEAKIHPLKSAGSLSWVEIKRLHHALIHVIQKALRKKGASVRNYVRPDGEPGTAHNEFNVAHGMGKKCPRCGSAIKRIVVRGRGTYICPECQRMP
jgi:formamidopyrimidine-DNA glycosylase